MGLLRKCMERRGDDVVFIFGIMHYYGTAATEKEENHQQKGVGNKESGRE